MAIDILIVDDEDDIRKLIKGILEDEGHATRQANGAVKAYTEIETRVPDLMILDIWLQGSEDDGLEILKKTKKKYPHLPVIMISGHGTIETAVSAIKMGAYDFIEKPFKSDRLLLMIDRAMEISQLRKENEALKERREVPAVMVGSSGTLKDVAQTIEKVANAKSRVLFTGDSGTGKGVAARMLHALSSRKDKPFLSLNCAIVEPALIEQELFGIEGTGGLQKGMIEQAEGGTLLLDEVGYLSLEAQGRVVRVLQEQKFSKINGKETMTADVRIVASTSRNLTEAMGRGDFREDLYYRLNVVPIHIPSLKNRREDIPALADHFVKQYSSASGQPARAISKTALIALQNYDWPGNIRQLKNIIEWAMIMGGNDKDEPIEKKDLPPEISGEVVSGESRAATIQDYLTYPLRDAREAFERDYLERQLSRFGGNISKTAAYVGMERSALHRKLKTLDLTNDKGDDDAAELKKAG